jgi:hypothetical protein
VREVWPAALAAVLATACSKEIVVGADPTSDAASTTDAYPTKEAGAMRDAVVDAPSESGLVPLVVPWSNGFENMFVDWSIPPGAGYCYDNAPAGTYTIVTTPVHTGHYAAAFMVNTQLGSPAQARCVRQGVLPPAAYYGAWYYVPTTVTTVGSSWNFLHFQGASSPAALATFVELWDVSVNTLTNGSLAPVVFDFSTNQPLDAGAAIPIATWFHLEIFLKPSDAGKGEVKVYLDGNVVFDLAGITTDTTTWGQWYVGSYATDLLQGAETVYVDDVTIDTTGP